MSQALSPTLSGGSLQLDSRAFAPLRRDERKAWDRAPGAREAYIAPALKPDGSANPPLDHPVRLGPGTPHRRDIPNRAPVRPVQDLRPRRAARIGRGQLPRPRTPVDALLEKYAQDILDIEPPPTSVSDEEFRAWRAHVRERVGTAIGEVRRKDEPGRMQIARQLADLPDRERIWGRDATIETGGRSSKRPR